MSERSTKVLADRIDLDYVRRRDPLRDCIRLLSWGLPLLAICLFIAFGHLRRDDLYSAAPVSSRHATFGSKCVLCHEEWHGVADAKCIACHDGAIHHDDVSLMKKTERPRLFGPKRVVYKPGVPGCASCHMEHRGAVRLSRPKDGHCVQCHDHLVVKDRQPNVAPTVTHFAGGPAAGRHPPFALPAADPSQILFNHWRHLQDLTNYDWDTKMRPFLASAGVEVTKIRNSLVCTDCHQLDSAGRYMKSIRFEKHCKDCHRGEFEFALGTDLRAKPMRLSHPAGPDAAEQVHGELLGRLTAYALENKPKPLEEPRKEEAAPGFGDLPPVDASSPAPSPAASPSALQWVAEEAVRQQQIFFLADLTAVEKSTGVLTLPPDKTTASCRKCHFVEAALGESATVPVTKRLQGMRIVPTAIPDRWLTAEVTVPTGDVPLPARLPPPGKPHVRSIFSHVGHRTLACLSCHTKVLSSKETADVNLPTIESCRSCHHPGGAQSDCVECHLYHDTKMVRTYIGPLGIHHLVRPMGLPPPAEKSGK